MTTLLNATAALHHIPTICTRVFLRQTLVLCFETYLRTDYDFTHKAKTEIKPDKFACSPNDNLHPALINAETRNHIWSTDLPCSLLLNIHPMRLDPRSHKQKATQRDLEYALVHQSGQYFSGEDAAFIFVKSSKTSKPPQPFLFQLFQLSFQPGRASCDLFTLPAIFFLHSVDLGLV